MSAQTWLNDVTKAFQEKLKTTDKILPSTWPQLIRENWASGGGGGGALMEITHPGGWSGTPLPSDTTTIIEKIYFNNNLTKEEVNELFANANLPWMEQNEGMFMLPVAINRTSNKQLIIAKFDLPQGMGDGIPILGYFIMFVATSQEILFNGIDLMEQDAGFLGWNPGLDYATGLDVNAANTGIDFSALSAMMSITPIEMLSGGTEKVTISGVFDGNKIELSKDDLQEVKWDGNPGTVVPRTGLVEKIYANTSFSIEETVNILKELTYEPLMKNATAHSIFTCMGGFNGQTVAGFGLGVVKMSDTNYQIIAFPPTSDVSNVILLFASETGNGLLGGTIDTPGWQNFENPIVFNAEAVEKHAMLTNLSGVENDKLISLFSITPFKITEKDTIDILGYISEKKLPNKIKMNFGLGYEPFLQKTIAKFSDEKITNLGDFAFANNTRLSEVNIPNCTSFGTSVFAGCYNLTSMNLSPKLDTIPYGFLCGAFDGNYMESTQTDAIMANFKNYKTISGNAFSGCNALSFVDFPECNSIGPGAFYNCYRIASISFPLCKYIGNSAFYGCTSLTEANFPMCSYINSYAFAYCTNLSSISFPVCTSINYNAFDNCSKLTTVDFPLCSHIDGSAFANCSKLTTVDFPLCSYIDGSAFAYCSNLTSVSFPNCKTIGNGAFYGCSGYNKLTTVDFPNVTLVYDCAFEDCRYLRTINLPNCGTFSTPNQKGAIFKNCTMLNNIILDFNKISLIPSETFYRCQALESLTLPVCNSIYPSAFYGCSNLQSLYLLNFKTFLADIDVFFKTPIFNSTYLGNYGSIYVPSNALSSYKLSSNWSYYADRLAPLPSAYDQDYVYANEFYSSTITKVPSERTTVKYILNSAFRSCYKLTTASFPNCTYIGASAFASCSSLAMLSFPMCETIGASAFYNCSSLTTVNFPVCETIGASAFYNCSSLTGIDFSNCKVIYTNAFGYCVNLNSLTLPNCEAIYGGFNNCSNLTIVDLPKCSYLTGFNNCSQLSIINAPLCKYVGNISRCSNLTTASFPLCETIGESAFYNCSNLTTISFPLCESIYPYAFQNCINLTEANFPMCMTINGSAFAYCTNLTTASFPMCETIKYDAFYKCSSLQSLYLVNSSILAKLSHSSVFADVSSTFKIYVHADQYENYKNATNWTNYAGRFVSVNE